SEEKPLDEEYERHTKQQIMHHRACRNADQVLAIVNAFNLHAGRQDAALINLVDLGLDSFDCGEALLATPHQHNAFHDVICGILADDPKTRLNPSVDLRDVRQKHGATTLLRQYGIFNVRH